MNSSRQGGDELLGGLKVEAAERLLTSLVNAEMPDDRRTSDTQSKLRARLRAQTQRYWPDLWQPHGEESDDVTAERATEILRKVRTYLQAFWQTQDPYGRDWYVHRAREWYWKARVQQDPNVVMAREEVAKATSADEARNASAWLNITFDVVLDHPPWRTAFEDSLFHLQGIAGKTRFCPNPKCQAPYFIALKKGQKFCSTECARPTLLASKRRYWDKRRRTK